MATRVSLLAAHVLLLLLASTSFTIVPGQGPIRWEYYRYIWQSGWGVPYQFPYSLPVVFTYLAAYGAGIATYWMAWRGGSPVIGLIGVLLCSIGLVSFAYELTHWFSDNYGAGLASAPIALLALAAAAGIQQYRLRPSRTVTA